MDVKSIYINEPLRIFKEKRVAGFTPLDPGGLQISGFRE
jgi:hypothetical protein